MSKRSIQLLTKFIEIQTYLMKMYKNAYHIQGQYNQRLKTTAAVMVKQYEKKIGIYDTLISEAAEKVEDASEEAYMIINALLQEHQNKNRNASLKDCNAITRHTFENSTDLIKIIDQIISLIDAHELDRSYLKDSLVKIREIEIKDNKALKHIIETSHNIKAQTD